MDDVFEVQKDHPALINLCLNCKYKDCIGRCRDYNALMRQLAETGEVKVRTRGESKLPTKRRVNGVALYEYQGEWRSVTEIAGMTGNSMQKIYARLIKTGGDIEAALDDERFSRFGKNKDYIKRYEVNGESHTISEWAEIVGIPYHRFHERLRRGHTVAEAVAMGQKPKKGRPPKLIFGRNGR